MAEVNWGQTGINWGLFAPQQQQGGGNAFSSMEEAQARREAQAEQRRQFDASHGLRQQESARQAQQFQQQFGLQQQQHQRQGQQFQQEFGLRQATEGRNAEKHSWDKASKQFADDDRAYGVLAQIDDIANDAKTPEERKMALDSARAAKLINDDQYQRFSTDAGYKYGMARIRTMKQQADAARAEAQAKGDKTRAEANKDNAQSRLYDAQAGAADQMWMPHPGDPALLVNKKTGEYKRIPDVAGPQGKVTPGYKANPDGSWSAIPGGPADVKMSEKRQQDFASMGYMFQKMDELAASSNELSNHPGLKGITGTQGVFPNIPGGAAANAEALRTTLLAKTAFGALQDMRNASKSGGALGSVTERELSLLQNAIVALEKSQSYDQYRANLAKLVTNVQASKARIAAAYNDHWNKGNEGAKSVASPTAPPLGGGPQAVPQGRDINQPPRVNSAEEMQRLAPGTIYIAPDGSTRQVP